MFLWTACFLSIGFGLHLLWPDLRTITPVNLSLERKALFDVVSLLQELEETLATGLVPAVEKWESLKKLKAPWASLTFESIQELRASGGSLLPTLKRLRQMALEQITALADARARSSQAMAQALTCAALVPLFGLALFALLPGIEEKKWAWLFGCMLALGFSVAAAAWLLDLAERARWAGLPQERRSWILSAQCAGERFLALVRAGSPADLAWTKTCELITKESPELVLHWGNSVWQDPEPSGVIEDPASLTLIEFGNAIRRAVQVSLMDGRPCTERVETALQGLRQDLRSLTDRELSLLATQALKPLFICIAPALVGLLAFGFVLSWKQLIGDSGF